MLKLRVTVGLAVLAIVLMFVPRAFGASDVGFVGVVIAYGLFISSIFYLIRWLMRG